jgi:Flp pilus assembly protein TadG
MMKMSLRNPLRDDRGAAVIELALIAPVLAFMTIGIIDVSQAFNRKLTLEQAAQRAIEKVMQTTGDTTPEETIKEEAAAQGDVDEDDVTVTYRLECNGEAEVDFDTECAAGETESRWLMVTVAGTYEPMFPMHFFSDEDDKIYHMTAVAGMRTS